MKTGFLLGLVLLAVQVGWVRSGARPALWAPFHHHAVFSVSVDVAGTHLGTREALARYGLPSWHYAAAREESWETNDLSFAVRQCLEYAFNLFTKDSIIGIYNRIILPRILHKFAKAIVSSVPHGFIEGDWMSTDIKNAPYLVDINIRTF